MIRHEVHLAAAFEDVHPFLRGDRTWLTDESSERPSTRHDLCGGGTDSRTVSTGCQGGQVVLLAFVQHVGTVGRTKIACPLAFRAGLRTLLHDRIVFHVIHLLLLRLPLLGKRHQRLA